MPSISLKTPVPGPKSRALLARREQAVPRGPFHVSPIFVERAAGATVTDVDGNVLLDFTGGLGVLNVGHANPHVVQAVREQAERYLHTCFHIAMYEPYVALAERLNRLVGGAHRKTLLVNSGAEAVENAVKIARYATGRPGVITFEHGFAGRTLLAMTLTSKVMPYKYGMGPFAPEVYRMPYPYFYRSGFTDPDAYLDHTIAQMREFFATHVDARQVACVWIELITGEGGFLVSPVRFVKALAALCREHGILLLVDEIQTGFGRTGKMFAFEHYGIEPDLVTTAKSLGGGLPVSAVTGRADLMDSVHVGGLGGTYGGNPLACVAALTTIEQIETLKLVNRAERIGEILQERMDEWETNFPCVGDTRGVGAMRALEFVKDRASREPDKAFTAALIHRCVEQGLLTLSAGTHSNVLRFLLPLVATDEQVNEGLDVIEQQMKRG